MPDNRTRRTIRRTSDYYIEGSAVRKLETLPEEYPSKQRRNGGLKQKENGKEKYPGKIRNGRFG